MTDWKRQHANESNKAVEHDLVQRAFEEFALNMGFELTGLPKYGLEKIASIAAQVSRAYALGIDPDDLRMTTQEANELQLEILKAVLKVDHDD